MKYELGRKLVLEAREASPDGMGGLAGSWTALGTHWGEFKARTGRLEAGEGFPRARVSYRVVIRSVPTQSPSRPLPGQRFREGDRVYYIRAVADEASDARYLACFVEEEVAA